MTKTKIQAEGMPSMTEGVPVRVGIQGYPGAFHEIAARYCFGTEPVEVVPARSFEEMVQALVEEEGTMDCAMMAIENTLAGSLMYNYTLLQEHDLCITGEVFLRIKQNFMALPGVSISDITEVHSHPIALAQVKEYFKNYPHIQLVESADTALTAREIRDNGYTHIGAVASTLAANVYGMEILAESIETNKQNFTRFLLLERSKGARFVEEADKVSLSFSVDHEVGSLYKVLAVLSAYNVNLTKIQSTPIIGKPWEYQFFLDFVAQGHLSLDQAIQAIIPITHELKILGTYKQGNHFE